MSLTEKFFQQVLDNPEDNTLRLIYADWLEEAGDPLGEFIRVQVELEQTPRSDLHWRTLKNRETELLDEYLADWMGPSARRVWKGFREAQYQPFFADRGSCRLHRGFRETARMRARTFLKNADGIFQTLPLRELHVFLDASAGERNQELTSLAKSESLKNVRTLILEYSPHLREANSPLQRPLLSLLKSPAFEPERLKFLYGFETRTLAAPLVRSDRLSKLETLELCRFEGSVELQALFSSNINEPRPRPARNGIAALSQAENLPSLKQLAISEHRLDDRDFEPVFHAPWFGQLRLLDLTGNSLSDETIRRLAASPVASQLESLRLSRRPAQQGGEHLQTAGCRALGEADFSRLKELSLGRQNISPGKLRALLKSHTLGNLELLDFSGNPLKDSGISALANCPLFENLRVLKLDSCAASTEAIAAFSESSCLNSLEELHLGGNRLTVAAMERLLNSPLMENLRVLSLADCPAFAERVFTRLANAESLENLTALDLSGQTLTKTRANRLADSPYLDDLTHLSWYQSPVAQRDHEAEAILHKRWPGRVRV